MSDVEPNAVANFMHDLMGDVRIRFRVVHLLYAIALLAAGMATFGGMGLFPALVILGAWAVPFCSEDRAEKLALTSFVMLFGLCFACALPAQQSAREAAYRAQCNGQLNQLALALHEYHEAFGMFPPAYIADENGRRLHSWRVLILPYLSEQALYARYNFNEPWDGPNNRRLLTQRPSIYGCSEQDRRSGTASTETNYAAVVGSDTAWPGATGKTFAELGDAASTTVLLMENSTHAIPWLEPRDLDLGEALAALSESNPRKAGGHHYTEFFNEHVGGHNVALADRTVRFVEHNVLPSQLRALLSTDTNVDVNRLQTIPSRARIRARLANWSRLAAFVLIALFPLPWAWRTPGKLVRCDRGDSK